MSSYGAGDGNRTHYLTSGNRWYINVFAKCWLAFDLHFYFYFKARPICRPYLARISAKIFGAEKSKSGADIRSRFCSWLQKLIEFINIAWFFFFRKMCVNWKSCLNIGAYIYYSFTTFGCIFMLVNASLCKVSSKKKIPIKS